MSFLEIKNLIKTYYQGDEAVNALNDISLKIEKGEFISIVGESGSGKSTLLHIIGGIESFSQGQVIIDNEAIKDYDEDQLSEYRRDKVNTIFQFYNLISVLTVEENILLPIRLAKRKFDKAEYQTLIDTVQLTKRVNFYPNQLSGGQRQRVAICRAILNKPCILLADEPTGNLDIKNTEEVMNLLLQLNKQYHITVIMVTHNHELALRADKVITIEDGSIKSIEKSN